MDVCTARIAQLSTYFDSLADLVPYKHYIDADDYLDLRHMKQKERTRTKAAFKQQHKLAKRAKLDPDAEISTTSAQGHSETDRGQNDAAPLAPWHNSAPGASADHSDLKERLSSKIQFMREQRKAEERKSMVAKAQAWKQKQHEAGVIASTQHKRKASETEELGEAHKPKAKAAQANAGDASDVMFNRLQVQEGVREPKKRKLSKVVLLKHVEAQAGQQNGELAPEKVSEESWKKMLQLAKGEKILDDPNRLRRSIKKEQKDKTKKAKVWKERNEAVQKKQAERQDKRVSNLQQRVDKKQARRKAKREARFLGAGFEGRTPALRAVGASAQS